MRFIMKRLIKKIKSKKIKKEVKNSRITNDTIAEHRELVLAGGRRFKYPIQYARHKLVFNAIIISFIALLLVVFVLWWQLFKVQNTSEFMYRIVKFIPIPVASVDGEPVLYSDYLMKYRSSIHYLDKKEQVDLKSEDGARRIEYVKQQSMKDAINYAYARKLSKKMNIFVDDKELNDFLKQQRQSEDGEISEKTYDAVTLDYYGWTPSELRYRIKNELLIQKIAYAVDGEASEKVKIVKTYFEKNKTDDLKKTTSDVNQEFNLDLIYGASGWVPKTNLDGGLANEASKLSKNDLSDFVKSNSGDGYFVVKLIDINDKQVSYEYLQVPLKKFSAMIEQLSNSKKIDEYIKI